MKDSSAHYVSIIKACGYSVFMRKPQTDEYCFYTDGTRIGYAQWSNVRGPQVASVHAPSRMAGTGFQIADDITAESLQAAIACHAPNWATVEERASVRKYSSWAAFRMKDAWNAEMKEV